VSILIGTNYYAARGDEARRQDGAINALRALSGIHAVNLQWPDDVYDVDGIATLTELRLDSRIVTGRDGRRKPIVSEVLGILAAAARQEGCRYFMFANADIEITQAAVALMEQDPREGFVFTRTDVDPGTRASSGVMQFGSDAFAFDTSWWMRNARRFRPYIAGEPVWDNVYTALLLTHANAEFVSREGLILHVRHEMQQQGSPFNDYTWYLAALDRPYFSLWAEFSAGLMRLPDPGFNATAVRALQARVFDARALRRGRVLQWARVQKARIRYAMRRRRS
jgi:hypothetical protein